MKPTNTINSVTFTDGYLYIMKFKSNGEINYKSRLLFYFGNRTITQKRIDEAAQIQARIDLCVHIPYAEQYSMGIEESDVVLLRNKYYRIERVQHILTTSPPCSVLTLSRWEMDAGLLDEGGE